MGRFVLVLIECWFRDFPVGIDPETDYRNRVESFPHTLHCSRGMEVLIRFIYRIAGAVMMPDYGDAPGIVFGN